MLNTQTFKCELNGHTISIETGKLAGQANGSVTVSYGDTVVLATVCIAPKAREGVDFLPLTIDYEERLYAAGKIPGGFIRREGRPTQEATLTARLTDRCLRPLMPKIWRRGVQVVVTVLSVDQENNPDILSIIGSSAALSISEMPFQGPVSAVHVGYLNDKLVINPTMQEMEESLLDIVVASSKEKVVMVEAGAKEAPEKLVIEAIEFGHKANQALITLQEELQKACGKEKEAIPENPIKIDVSSAIESMVDEKVTMALDSADRSKRNAVLAELKQELLDSMGETYSEDEISYILEKKAKAVLRANVLGQKKRVSGRTITEVRPISCEVGLLPRTHGSGLFERGQTQVMTVATLGPIKKEQMLEGLGLEESKRYIHHYNFPPYSTGEVKRMGSPGRREIGHGALAERALIPVLPKHEDFPYTIRLVSEALSSNGSTSMASTCASSLCLMDAGIPIKRAVSGIAMGLVTDDNGNFVVLTDLEGLEDFYGDMDFKVAGTSEGITALQMDTKLNGLTMEIITQTINQSHEARMYILDIMNKTIAVSRNEVNAYAPRMHKMKINPDKIGAVIGAGGKTIRAITDETKATVDIENDGTIIIGSPDAEATRKTIQLIEQLTKEVEVGEIYTGKVSRIMNFGAMVEILPGKEGLVHISALADYHVNSVEDIVKVGDEVTVKVVEIDNMGRINLSRKALLSSNSDSSDSKPSGSSGSGSYQRPRAPRSQQRPPRGGRPPYRSK